VLISILVGTGIGVLLGTVSGLVPGIHANTMAGVLLSLQAVLLAYLDPVVLATAMFGALVTHTFLDIIPSTFLGIPDADTALAVLPAHALCLEGRGEEAVRISALGSALGVVFAVPILAFCFLALPSVQPFIDWGIGLLILAVAGFLIVMSESPGWAAAIFGVSGLLGLFTFRFSYLAWHTVGDSAVLMPLLAGLFGISVLLTASRGIMPPQESGGPAAGECAVWKGSALGAAAGAMVGWMPGLSNATANALLTGLVGYDSRPRDYILATGAANTVNAFLGLAALYAIARTRNGVMVALSTADLPPFTALLLGGVLAAFAAYLLTVLLAGSASLLGSVDVRFLNYGVIVFVVVLALLLSGPFGGLVLLLATAVGLVPQMVNVRRVYCMGAVMLPVMLYSFGIAVP
jgi:putative membrane protein